jgi:phosphonate transport system substrate-binding protein
MKREFKIGMQLFVLLAMVMVACAGCSQPAPAATTESNDEWPEEFNMGYFGGDDPSEVIENVEWVRAYMEEHLGIKVNVFTGTSYTAVIEAMRNKKVDSMAVGPFSYILAVEEAGAEALGVGVYTRADPPVYDASLVPYYYSVVFTKKGSGINSVADLKGRTFNFVDPASTSGHLMPKTLLIKRGITPDEDMTTVFAGSHPSSVISVWNDKAEAGATYESNLNRLAEEGQVEFCGFEDGQTNKARSEEDVQALFDACPEGKLVILAYSDPIPSTPFAIRSDLPESFKAAVKEALIALKDKPDLIAIGRRWYVDPSEDLGLERLDQFYNPLRDAAKLLDLDLNELK